MTPMKRGDGWAALLVTLAFFLLAWAVANLSLRVSALEKTVERLLPVNPLDFLCPDCMGHPALVYAWFARNQDFWLCLRCGNAFPEKETLKAKSSASATWRQTASAPRAPSPPP